VDDDSGMLAIFVTVKIKPDLRQRFLDAIEDDSISSVRDEPGCVDFQVLQDRADPDTYYFYEVYRDEEALEAHRRTPHFERWDAASREVLRAPAARLRLNRVLPRS
jgi:(4S)-4-hydroxy-5-phosphonooxypentane-2,3-dione isomerase